MMKKAVLIVTVLYLSGLFVTSVKAGGGMTGGATEFTQIANNGELITQVGQLAEQIEKQIQMVEDMIFNTMELPMKLAGDVTGMINGVMEVYNKSQGILNRLSNIDEEFYNRFYSELEGAGGSKEQWVENYSDQYYELSKAIDAEAKKRVESLKVTADDITDSAKMLEKLSKNSGTAEGRNAIMKAGNEFLGYMAGEMLKTRTLLAEQTKTYLDYAERERAVEDAAAEILKQDLGKWKDPGHSGDTHESSKFSW